MQDRRRRNVNDEEQMQSSEQREKAKKERSLRRVQTANNVNSLLDLTDILAIFAMHLKENWRNYLVQTARYPMFIAAAGFAVIAAILAGRKANLMGNRNGSAQFAAIKSIAAILIAGAVGIGLFGPAAIAELAPYIFAGVLGYQFADNLVKAFGAFAEALSTSNQDELKQLKQAIKDHGVGAVVLGLVTSAVIAVMILKMNELAVLGVSGTGLGIAYTLREMTKGTSRRSDGYEQVPTENVLELDDTEEPEARPNSDLVVLKQMKETVSTNNQAKKKETKEESPYQPIPVLEHSTSKIVQLPSVKGVNLGGTIKSAAEMQRTGTDSSKAFKEEEATFNIRNSK